MLHSHAELHHQHQEEDHEGVFVVVVGEVQHQQRGHMAHAVDADHDAPLQLGIALQKTLRVIGQSAYEWQRQKNIDRNEHRKHVKVLGANQPILHGQNAEKSQHQTAMVATTRR